jgi:predicted phage tail protein
MALQDDQVQAFSDAVTAQLQQIGTSLDNIAADEANLLKQIQDLQANAGELTPDNQAKLQTIIDAATAMAQKTSGIADNVPDAAPPTP